VIAQLPDDRLCFLPDNLVKLRGLGVAGAGEGKILPDHDAFLIAQVEEGMVFIDVPAPTAEHVTS